MPSSGEIAEASASPPLASAYARTAAMKLIPVSGPATSSSSANDVEPNSSRRSFERKEHLFEIGLRPSDASAQLGQIAGGDGAPVVEQEKAVADARRVGELMNGEDERASAGGAGAKKLHRRAGLPEVEAVERLVEK